MSSDWECIVVGGGAAGLSAALVLGRARRRTLLIDAGAPSNLPAHGIGGLLGQDGRPPAELYADGRRELEKYPSVEVRGGEVADGRADGDGFALDGERTARVVLATGMDYRYPAVDGAADRWGDTVFHCPFCHGWEVRERPLAVLDTGAIAVHRALLLRKWSDEVTLLCADVAAEDRERLQRAGVRIDERPVAALRGPGVALEHVVFEDGDTMQVGGVLVGATLHQRSELAAQLGAGLAPPNPVVADAIAIDGMGATSVPGLYAAGDCATPRPSIQGAIAAGAAAATGVVASLL